MSRSGASSRVSIPDNVRKTIQDIKEVTGKHSEEDIYAMLKECSMEPNETIDRLLYLDTFHEVKSKRDKRKEVEKRKENLNSRVPEESMRKSGFQGRGDRGGRGYFPSPDLSHEPGGGRNAAIRKENGVDSNRMRVNKAPPTQLSKEADAKTLPVATKSTSSTVNGTIRVPNSSPQIREGNKQPTDALTNLPKDVTDSDVTLPKNLLPQARAHLELAPSTPEPILISSHDSRLSSSVGAIEREVRNQRATTDSIASVPTEEGVDTCCDLVDQLQVSQLGPQGVDEADISSSILKGAIEHENILQSMRVSESLDIEKGSPSESSLLSAHPVLGRSLGVNSSPQQLMSPSGGSGRDLKQKPTSVFPSEATAASEAVPIQVEGSSQLIMPKSSLVDDATLKLEKLKFSDGQHVIIPNHIQVPDSVKSILSFGSLDASFVDGINLLKDPETTQRIPADLLNEETVEEPSSRCSKQDASSIVQDEHYSDPPQAPSHVQEEGSLPESQVTSDADLSDSQLKHEELPAVGPPYPVAQNTPSYGFSFLPHMLGSPLAQLDGLESQSNSMSENSQTIAATASILPPPVQSPGVGQSSISLPPPLPLFRQPYPHSYIPYSPYYPPFYMPPTLHQYFGHSGFPPQLPTSNMFLQQPGSASGMKVSPAATYKPGTSTGNAAHVGMPPGYGVYSSLQLGYGPSAAGNSNGNEELVAAAALKETNVYPGQQQSEAAPPVWIPAGGGRESSSFPVNSFFNLPPQVPHVTMGPQSGHGAFTAIYSPLQTIPNLAAGHPVLQQSQPPVAGPLESAGPLPQRQQINWNSGF
ncbi:hypothetical protein Dimus_014439 [Dionaea muscipula]